MIKFIKKYKIIEPALKLTKATTRWAKKGFPIAEDELYAVRKSECSSCEYWDSSAFSGFGKCRICGCSKLKLKFKTESCPIGKW